MSREIIEHQRSEPLRLAHVVRESTDGGTTWTRLSLSGMHYARDIRAGQREDAELLLAIRDDDVNAYATLEGEEIQLEDEDAPSAVGVIIVEVPRAVALAALPRGDWPTDECLIDANGDPVFLAKGTVRVDGRITVIEEA